MIRTESMPVQKTLRPIIAHGMFIQSKHPYARNPFGPALIPALHHIANRPPGLLHDAAARGSERKVQCIAKRPSESNADARQA